jgi:N-acetylneuraminate synthase
MVAEKTLLIGEIGLSHEGSLGTALSMVKACKEAKLDFAKFQLHQPDFESTESEMFRVNVFPQDSSRYNYWKRTSFSETEWKIIIEYCKNIDIGFLCTPFSVWAAQQLVNFGIGEVKIASGDANNWELLEFVKLNFNKVIVSTGMSTKAEVKKLAKFMNDYQGEFIIMQCTSSYPVKPKNVGMRYFKELQKLTKNVGLSDHTGIPLVSIAAIASNASIVEFHVVFSRNQFGPDSNSSVTFEEASLISNFRDLWLEVFDSEYDKDSIAEKLSGIREKFGRGLALKMNLAKGQVVSPELFTLKKPRGSMTWDERNELLGKRAIRDLSANQHLNKSDFE